jgi:hypothetical protein
MSLITATIWMDNIDGIELIIYFPTSSPLNEVLQLVIIFPDYSAQYAVLCSEKVTTVKCGD